MKIRQIKTIPKISSLDTEYEFILNGITMIKNRIVSKDNIF